MNAIQGWIDWFLAHQERWLHCKLGLHRNVKSPGWIVIENGKWGYSGVKCRECGK